MNEVLFLLLYKMSLDFIFYNRIINYKKVCFKEKDLRTNLTKHVFSCARTGDHYVRMCAHKDDIWMVSSQYACDGAWSAHLIWQTSRYSPASYSCRVSLLCGCACELSDASFLYTPEMIIKPLILNLINYKHQNVHTKMSQNLKYQLTKVIL